MRFDVIIGNPPYQSGKYYVSLWPKFWSQSFRLLRPGGFVTLVTPRTWCSPAGQLSGDDKVNGHRRLWNVFDTYTSHARVHGLGRFFPGVGSTFSVVTVDTSGSEGLSFDDPDFDVTLGFYPLSNVREVREQLATTNNIGQNYRMSQTLSDTLRVSLPKTRRITEETCEVIEAGGTPRYKIDWRVCTFIYCDTRDQAEHVRRRVIECSDILCKYCRYNGFLEHEVLKMIRLTPDPRRVIVEG